MNPLIVISLLAVIPVVLTLLFRVNAALVFLALCAGSVLAQFVGDDAMRLFDSFMPDASSLLHAAVRVGLLVLPALLTIIFMRRSISGTKHVLNIVPAILTGFVAAILVVPLLSDGTKYAIYGSASWDLVKTFQGTVIGAATLASFLLLWTTFRGRANKKHHK